MPGSLIWLFAYFNLAAGNHRPTPTSCSSDFVQHDPSTSAAGSQVGTRCGESVVSFDHQVVVPSDQAYVMSGGLSSSNYGPMYDCNRYTKEFVNLILMKTSWNNKYKFHLKCLDPVQNLPPWPAIIIITIRQLMTSLPNRLPAITTTTAVKSVLRTTVK